MQQGMQQQQRQQTDPNIIREDQVENAVSFLSHPKVTNTSPRKRVGFLEKKGLTPAEIAEALERASPDAPETKLVQAARRNGTSPLAAVSSLPDSDGPGGSSGSGGGGEGSGQQPQFPQSQLAQLPQYPHISPPVLSPNGIRPSHSVACCTAPHSAFA